MSITLETLELTQDQLKSCKDAVQKMAYFDWRDAGCPECGQLEFWLKAERDWIEHFYVPNRVVDGELPQTDSQPAMVAAGEIRQQPGPSKARRGFPAKVKVQ